MRLALCILLMVGCIELDSPHDTISLLCEVVIDDEYSVQANVDEVVTFTLLHWRQRITAQRELGDARVTFMVKDIGNVGAVYDAGLTVLVDGQLVGNDEHCGAL